MNETKKFHVLLVEDSSSLTVLYQEYLKSEDCILECVDTGARALEAIKNRLPDVVLLDLNLPDIQGTEILKHINDNSMPIEVVVITAHGSVDVAVEAMRSGAFDFMVKPFEADRLRVTLRNAMERHRLNHMVEVYKENFERESFHGITGASLPMQAVYRIIESAAPSKATVFITGESGTGKELCARAVHDLSPRAKGPLVTLNCAAIPRDLMESEIFGHVKGAFTGAYTDREGAASRADGGTLFLDEICEMDLELQSKLLRFTQTGCFQKLGDNKEKCVDIRFVCATNRDPLEEVRAGRFREDLYYRFHVIPIQLPSLRERESDVVLIANKFLTQYASEENKQFRGFSQDALRILQDYSWPGNVRELQNILRNAVVLNDGEILEGKTLQVKLSGSATSTSASATAASQGKNSDKPITSSIETPPHGNKDGIIPLHIVERQAIEQAIDICDGNIPMAAALLDVSPSTIYRKRQAWQDRN